MKRKCYLITILIILIAYSMQSIVIATNANKEFNYAVTVPSKYKVINSSYTNYYEMQTFDYDNSDTYFRITVYDKQFFKDYPNGNMWFSSWVDINEEDMCGFWQKCLDADAKKIEKNNPDYKVTKQLLLNINGYPARRLLAVGPSGYTIDVFQIVSNNYFTEFYFYSENEKAAKDFTDSQTQKSILKSFKLNNDSASNCENKNFSDVYSTDWFYNAVKFAYTNKMMSGYADNKTFGPNDKLTRGMMVTILYKMEGSPVISGKSKFSDVKSTEYYAKAVKWATDKGIVHGYSGTNKFGPNDNIIRQDLAGILRNYAKYKNKNINITSSLKKFKDYKKIDSYANASMQWAVGKGVITGNSDGTLNPKGTATRAEAAAMIQKYCNKVGK